MNETPSNRMPLSPVEQLANVCDALIDDELFEHVEIDEAHVERARNTVNAAIAEALGTRPQDAAPDKTLGTSGKVSDTLRTTGTEARALAERGLDSAARGLTKAARRLADMFRSKVNK